MNEKDVKRNQKSLITKMASFRFFNPKINHPCGKIGFAEQWWTDECAGDQVDDIDYFHISAQRPYELKGVDGTSNDPASEKQYKALPADAL